MLATADCAYVKMAAKIHPINLHPLAWLEKPGLEPEQVDTDAWLEPEHVDEGHEATPTTHGVACNDWSAMLPTICNFPPAYSTIFSYNKISTCSYKKL